MADIYSHFAGTTAIALLTSDKEIEAINLREVVNICLQQSTGLTSIGWTFKNRDGTYRIYFSKPNFKPEDVACAYTMLISHWNKVQGEKSI